MRSCSRRGGEITGIKGVELHAAADRGLALLARRPLSVAFAAQMKGWRGTAQIGTLPLPGTEDVID